MVLAKSLPTSTRGVRSLPGVGPVAAAQLARLGIRTLSDLIEHLPTRHESYGQPIKLAAIKSDQIVTVQAELISFKSRRSFRKRLTIQEGILSDDSGSMGVVWFNQPYLNNMQIPAQLFLRGKAKTYNSQLTLVSPEIIKDPKIINGANALQPVYPLSGRLTTRQLRFWVRTALPSARKQVDPIPKIIRERLELMPRLEALKELHFPSDPDKVLVARKRMTFEELFLLSLFILRERQAVNNVSATSVAVDEALLKEFVASLPYQLTNAQRKASWQIIKDLAKPHPMNRLLEGDVGSGKTVVAAMAMLAVAKKGGQAVLLAPTVILAQQHAQTLRDLLKPAGLEVGLLTGTSGKDKKTVIDD
ncbi:MAG: DEAD/DEAH box helicase, partial [Candidatus Paceibacterota bacterium]